MVCLRFSSAASLYSSLDSFFPLRISLMLTSNNSLIVNNASAGGKYTPVSQRDIVLLVTPILSPSCSCVNPCSFLSSAMNLPICVNSTYITSGETIANAAFSVFTTNSESLYTLWFNVHLVKFKFSERVKLACPIAGRLERVGYFQRYTLVS